MQFKHIVCGGTFDHLHAGHKKLLSECLQRGKQVTVGITNRALTRHKAYTISLESYGKRVKNVLEFSPNCTIYLLSDIFGPTLTDTSIDAICVTKDTFSGANMINDKRMKLGMTALSIIMVPFAYDQNHEKISSERIRQGILDREGNRYDISLFSKEQFILPESLRGVLRKPLGHSIASFSSLSKYQMDKIQKGMRKRGYFYYCAIGDMVTLELRNRGITQFISLIDGITQRKALNRDIIESILEKDRYEAINHKGTIAKEACLMIQKIFDMGHKRATKQLYIHGEEDLLTLAVALFAPLGAHIWYGQQGVGAIDIHVTEKIKQTVYNLLQQFD